ncbi:hypothetical protein ABZS66_41665 [Dactylosporangium sp. NPDC005572]|uniref:hypothetical protein n=1 Tax=Dactylosporangium sp. NPDC005572 TaxID=3156889 RepID=UPI0033A2AD8D
MPKGLLLRATEEGTAAGIYGLIVSGAVMATSHAHSALATALAVLLTLAVYWSAERYARLVAERIHDGHRPAWPVVRRQLSSGWEIVTASALPLAALVVLDLFGVEQFPAVLLALAGNTALLSLAGWEVGRAGRLSTAERVVSTAVAGSFGVVLVALKAALH